MDVIEFVAGTATWAAKNLAYNLDFIPDDKLNWKPSPEAKSALEIVNHTAGAFRGFIPVLSGGEWAMPDASQAATDRASAKKSIIEAAEEYAAAVQKINRADLGNMIQLPFGQMPLFRVASMPLVDVLHHHGQIAYIQTALGDNEDHFDMSLM